jgi:chromosome segregation ATPase
MSAASRLAGGSGAGGFANVVGSSRSSPLPAQPAPGQMGALAAPPRGQGASRPLAFEAPSGQLPRGGGGQFGPPLGGGGQIGPPASAPAGAPGALPPPPSQPRAAGESVSLQLKFEQLEQEVNKLREALSVEQQQRERLTAKVHTDKGAVGENTMGTFAVRMQELQETATRDRAVLHELEHHLSEERNARVTVEDDIDAHIERLEQQEKNAQRDVAEVKKEIEHVGTEVTAMYTELTQLQQQIMTQLRSEYEAAVRKLDAKMQGLVAENTKATQVAQDALQRVARLEERIAAREDDHHEKIEELEMLIANNKTQHDADLKEVAGMLEDMMNGTEKKQGDALAAVVVEQKDHSAAIHNCMDMLEHDVATNTALKEAEDRLAASINRVGSGVEESHAAVAGLTDGLAACSQDIIQVERLASDVDARLEQLGADHARLEQSAEAAMDTMDEELQGKIAMLADETGEFEEMVQRNIREQAR